MLIDECPKILCSVKISPPFIIKWLAKECRRTCADWPFGNSIFADLSARPKALIELEKQPYFLRCWFTSANSSGDTGIERFLPLLVFVKVNFPSCNLSRVSPSASPHRAPVARLILVINLTCGFKEKLYPLQHQSIKRLFTNFRNSF